MTANSRDLPPPPVVSQDGRFYWDGQTWTPFHNAGGTVSPRREIAAGGVFGRLLLIALILFTALMALTVGGALGALLLLMAAALGFLAARTTVRRA